MPGPINGVGTRSHCSWDGALPSFQGAVLVLLAPLRKVSVMRLHGVWGSILFLSGREGLILDKDRSPVPLSLETGKVSHRSLPPPPSPPSRPHCISHRPGSTRFWQRRQVPSPQPAHSLLPSSALGALLLACCHCHLPPELSPLGVWDSADPGLPVTTFPSSPSADNSHPACKSQHACINRGGSPHSR